MIREAGLWIGLAVLVVVFWAAWVWVLQWAWNTFAPAIGVGSIGYLQAFALSILIAALTRARSSRA